MIKFMCCGKASRCNLFLAPRLFLIWGWVISLVQGQLIIILAHTTCYLICISNSPQGYESDWLRCQLLDFLYMSPSVKRLREDDDNAASEKRLSYYIHFDASSFMSAGHARTVWWFLTTLSIQQLLFVARGGLLPTESDSKSSSLFQS